MKCRDCRNETDGTSKYCSSCREKNRLRCKQYRLDNPEVRKKADREYSAAHSVRKAEYARQYRMLNPEKCREQDRHKDKEKKRRYMKEYAEKNKDRIRQQKADNHTRNYALRKDEINARNREWFRNNRDKSRDKTARYRAIKVAAFVERVDSGIVYARDNHTCKLCGLPVVKNAGPYNPLYPSIDHIIPLSKGGKHSYENVQTAHRGCNSSKLNRTDKNPNYVPVRLA